MTRTTQELLGELALVNHRVPMVTLDMLNNKLSVDEQLTFGARLVRLGEAFQQHAKTERLDVIDSEAQS